MPDGSAVDTRRRTFNGETRAQAIGDGATIEGIDAAIRAGRVVESPAGCLFSVAVDVSDGGYSVKPSEIRALSPEGRRALIACIGHAPKRKAIKAKRRANPKPKMRPDPWKLRDTPLPVVDIRTAGSVGSCVIQADSCVELHGPWRERGDSETGIDGHDDRFVRVLVDRDLGPCEVYRFGETGEVRIKVSARKDVLARIAGRVKVRATRVNPLDDDAPIAPVDEAPTAAEIEASMPLAWEAADAASEPAPNVAPATDAPYAATMLEAWNVDPLPTTAHDIDTAEDGNCVSRAMARKWQQEMADEDRTAATGLAESLAALGVADWRA